MFMLLMHTVVHVVNLNICSSLPGVVPILVTVA